MRCIPGAAVAIKKEGRSRQTRPPLTALIRRPVSLLSLVPTPVVLFMAGAVAGAVGKTIVAPLDRVKILIQVKGGMQNGALREAAVKGQLFRSLWAILKTEGVLGFWKGNLPQILRVIPYSAVQLGTYELLKRSLQDEDGNLTVSQRLVAGAVAGMCSTIVTYPLDMLRFRLAVDPDIKTVQAAFKALSKEAGAGVMGFYRGLKPAVMGIAPYMALELASYDVIPPSVPSFVRGLMAALIATSFCYPLDTVRRMKQLTVTDGLSSREIVRQIVKKEGLGGLYRGFVPNAIKNLPNKGIRLSTFDAAKTVLATSKAAYAEEVKRHSPQETDPKSTNKLETEICLPVRLLLDKLLTNIKEKNEHV